MNSVVLGVAGKCCSGKDTVSSFFIDRGFEDVNVDRIGHLALTFKNDEVVERFGADVCGPDGMVDRGRLGRIVFGSPEALADLEAILHPWMVDQVRLAIENANGPVVINAALLFPMGLDRFCNIIIWTDASFFARFKRARRRDRLSIRQVFRRLYTQRRLRPQETGSRADMITVKNSGSRAELFKTLETILGEILAAGD